MYKYEVVVWWSKQDELYVAEVPELAGCISDGHTYGQAIDNVQVVIGEWLHRAQELGRPIPEPQGRLILA